MGLLSLLRRSWRKSLDLKRISSVLGRRPPMTVEDLMETAEEHDLAEEQLYDLVQHDKDLQVVMANHGATRDDLRKIYHTLLAAGAGQWVKGHWVVASALAFGGTLDFVLSRTDNGEKSGRDIWKHVAFALVEYFEKGRMGSISV